MLIWLNIRNRPLVKALLINKTRIELGICELLWRKSMLIWIRLRPKFSLRIIRLRIVLLHRRIRIDLGIAKPISWRLMWRGTEVIMFISSRMTKNNTMPTTRVMKKTPPTTPPTMAPTGAYLEEAFLEGVVEGFRKELVGVKVGKSVDGPVGVEVGESVDEGEENESVSYVLDSLGYPIGY